MKCITVSVCAVAAVASSSAADIIYNSTQPHTPTSTMIWLMADPNNGETASYIELTPNGENEARVGAALTFAGTNRFVDRVEIPCAVNGMAGAPQTATFELAFYTDAGNTPGTLIWSGSTVTTMTGPGPVVSSIFTPNITLPNTVFYTLAYSNIQNLANRAFGSRFNNVANATVGSHSQQMTQDSTTLAWAPSPFTTPQNSIEILVNAIPTPGTLALAALAAFRMHRRRR